MVDPFRRAAAAAATLTGKRFGLLVASSLVATSAIVASALTGAGNPDALAALLARGLGSGDAPAAATPAAGAPSSTPGSAGPSAQPEGESARGSAPLPAPVPPASPKGGDPKSAPATPSTPAAQLPKAGRIKHVFVISLASPGYDAAFGATPQMPYLASTLRPQGELLSGYSLLNSAGLPNAIAAISGQPPNAQTESNCPVFGEFQAGSALDGKGVVSGAGCVYPVEALTIADQLVSGRFRWRAYVEGMVDEEGKPDNCAHPDFGGPDQPAPGGYAARQNPFAYFHSLLDLGDCAINDLPLTRLETDLSKIDSTPNYSFIAPSLCNAGVTGQCPAGTPDGAASADSFLAQLVPKILASPAYEKDGLLIVTFGEVSPTDTSVAAPPAPENPQVGALLLSHFVSPGSTDPVPYDPYSLLRSVEDLFGLSHLAKANGADVKSFALPLLRELGGD